MTQSKTGEIISIGDVVQIAPNSDNCFGACFLLVTEVRDWGVQGFVAIPQERGKSPAEAYLRVKYEDIVRIGTAEWQPLR